MTNWSHIVKVSNGQNQVAVCDQPWFFSIFEIDDFGWNPEVTIYVSLIRRVSERKHTEKWNGKSCTILEWGWKQGHCAVLTSLFVGHTRFVDLVAAFHNGHFKWTEGNKYDSDLNGWTRHQFKIDFWNTK